jgi:hypothetical protein
MFKKQFDVNDINGCTQTQAGHNKFILVYMVSQDRF